MKITVAGTGYVGLSLAVLLSQKHQVRAVDLIQEKVDLINQKKSPITDKEIEEFLNQFETAVSTNDIDNSLMIVDNLIILISERNNSVKLYK